MSVDDRYYYEPASGHGLPHDPLNAIVGPRPIGWISSRNAAGQRNLAPYSFLTASIIALRSLVSPAAAGKTAWRISSKPASLSGI